MIVNPGAVRRDLIQVHQWMANTDRQMEHKDWNGRVPSPAWSQAFAQNTAHLAHARQGYAALLPNSQGVAFVSRAVGSLDRSTRVISDMTRFGRTWGPGTGQTLDQPLRDVSAAIQILDRHFAGRR